METHFVRLLGEREQLCRKIEIIPLEVVFHNRISGSLALKLGVEGSAMFSPRFTNTIEMHDGEGREMLFNYRSRAVSWGAAAWVQAELLRVIIGVGYSASSLELSKHFSATTRTTYDDYPQGIFARVGVYF